MIPSLDDRLDSIVRAIGEVILPALPDDRPLAIEQAHLALAHLGLIRQQLDLAPAFERREAAATLDLAGALCEVAAGGERTMAAAHALRAASAAARLDDTAAAGRVATDGVGAAIEALIEASGIDGDAAYRADSLRLVLAAGRAAAMRERAWSRAAGFESDDSAVPS